MRISDGERGAICLLNVTAELHQRFTLVKRDTAEANILSYGGTFPPFIKGQLIVGLVTELFTSLHTKRITTYDGQHWSPTGGFLDHIALKVVKGQLDRIYAPKSSDHSQGSTAQPVETVV